MNPDLQPRSNIERNEFQQLLILASEIERKFDFGRATDIRPPLIQGIVHLSIMLRKRARDSGLKDHLADIEDTAYAILDNTKKPDYYKNLRALLNQIKSLREFEEPK